MCSDLYRRRVYAWEVIRSYQCFFFLQTSPSDVGERNSTQRCYTFDMKKEHQKFASSLAKTWDPKLFIFGWLYGDITTLARISSEQNVL